MSLVLIGKDLLLEAKQRTNDKWVPGTYINMQIIPPGTNARALFVANLNGSKWEDPCSLPAGSLEIGFIGNSPIPTVWIPDVFFKYNLQPFLF